MHAQSHPAAEAEPARQDRLRTESEEVESDSSLSEEDEKWCRGRCERIGRQDVSVDVIIVADCRLLGGLTCAPERFV